MRELLNKCIPLSDLLNINFLEVALVGKPFNEIIYLFEQFIKNLIFNFHYQDIIDYSIKQIYSFKGNLNISKLSKTLVI